MITPDAPHTPPSVPDGQPFPHHSAPVPAPVESAERQQAEPPHGVPRWQPEEGDFS